MDVQKQERLPVQGGEDVVKVRQVVRDWAGSAGFRLVEQTKLVTAASEIARNTVQYGSGGSVLLQTLSDPPKRGLRLVFEALAQWR